MNAGSAGSKSNIVSPPVMALNQTRISVPETARKQGVTMRFITVFSALFAYASTAHAGNLVTNGDFSNGKTGWTLRSQGSFVIDSGNGNPAPSAAVTALGGLTSASVQSDCITIGAVEVTLSADILFMSGSEGNVSVQPWSGTGCAGSPLSGGPSIQSSISGWQHKTASAMLPAATQSVLVLLIATGQSGPSSGFDNISFVQGTTPVVLQQFSVD